jgi:hypothetical protein
MFQPGTRPDSITDVANANCLQALLQPLQVKINTVPLLCLAFGRSIYCFSHLVDCSSEGVAPPTGPAAAAFLQLPELNPT